MGHINHYFAKNRLCQRYSNKTVHMCTRIHQLPITNYQHTIFMVIQAFFWNIVKKNYVLIEKS